MLRIRRPGRLAARGRSGRSAAAIAVALAVAGASLAGCASSNRGRATAPAGPVGLPPGLAPSSAAPTGFPETGADTPGTDDSGAPSKPAPPAALSATVAIAFAAAWIRSDLPADQWYAGVAPLCEAGFAKSMHTVNPANVPARKILGPPVVASPATGALVVYHFAADSGTLSVTVAVIAGRWLVANNDFVRTIRR